MAGDNGGPVLKADAWQCFLHGEIYADHERFDHASLQIRVRFLITYWQILHTVNARFSFQRLRSWEKDGKGTWWKKTTERKNNIRTTSGDNRNQLNGRWLHGEFTNVPSFIGLLVDGSLVGTSPLIFFQHHWQLMWNLTTFTHLSSNINKLNQFLIWHIQYALYICTYSEFILPIVLRGISLSFNHDLWVKTFWKLLEIFGSFLFFQGRQLQRKKLPVQEPRWCYGSHCGSRLGRCRGITRLL